MSMYGIMEMPFDSCSWQEFGCQKDMIFCGVFDGHGPWGHFVAKCVRESLPSSLLSNLFEASTDSDFDLDSDKLLHEFDIWKHSYTKACAAVDHELEQHPKIDSFYSGTTSLTIVRQVIPVVLLMILVN